MKLQQIRNATVKLQYDNQILLVDPMLSSKGTLPSMSNKNGNTEKNPIVDLPNSIEDILSGVTAIVVTHNHIDHWDSEAVNIIRKDMPVFVQDEVDQHSIKNDGFTDVRVINTKTKLHNITFTKTTGKHYENNNVKNMLEADFNTSKTMGFYLSTPSEKSILFTGDTIWFDGLENNLRNLKPDIVVMNSGGNGFSVGRLILNSQDVVKINRALPKTLLIASHMEAVNHWTTSRKELAATAEKNGFKNMLKIPKDGDMLTF